jgi:hypothetical protein
MMMMMMIMTQPYWLVSNLAITLLYFNSFGHTPSQKLALMEAQLIDKYLVSYEIRSVTSHLG